MCASLWVWAACVCLGAHVCTCTCLHTHVYLFVCVPVFLPPLPSVSELRFRCCLDCPCDQVHLSITAAGQDTRSEFPLTDRAGNQHPEPPCRPLLPSTAQSSVACCRGMCCRDLWHVLRRV